MMNFLRKQMKWVMAIIVVAFLLSTFLMYEGRGTRRTPTRNADGTMSDYEVAQINGHSLMRSELDTRLRNYLSSFNSRNTASLDMPALYQSVLNQAVLESQLLKEIDEQGIKISDAEADRAMKNEADTYYPTRETFYETLKRSGITVEDYKRNLARQLAVNQLMNNAVGEIKISEDKAVEFYDSMKKMFYTRPEGYMVHMADFSTSADAEAFRARLTAGESWDVIASEDRAVSSDIINITKEPVFLPESALRIGTLSVLASIDIAVPSEVFAVSSSDFAVGMKTSKVEETTTPYEEVSADIKTLLTQEERRKRLSEYEDTLRAKANLVINDAELFASKAASADEQAEPQFIIEEISDDEEPVSEDETPAVVEEVKAEETPTVEAETAEEVKEEVNEPVEEVEEEAKPEENSTPETEEVEEVKAEAEVSEDETPAPVEEAKEEVKAEETPTVETETTEEVKEEVNEPVEEAEEEAKPEENSTPETEKVEEVEEVKEVKAEAEVSEDEAPAPVEEVKASEVPAVIEEIKEEVKTEAAKLIEEVKEAVTEITEITESKDIPLQEEVKEN